MKARRGGRALTRLRAHAIFCRRPAFGAPCIVMMTNPSKEGRDRHVAMTQLRSRLLMGDHR
jgi:hypothetical protein